MSCDAYARKCRRTYENVSVDDVRFEELSRQRLMFARSRSIRDTHRV